MTIPLFCYQIVAYRSYVFDEAALNFRECAASPVVCKFTCVRFTCFVRLSHSPIALAMLEITAPPPHAQHSVRVGGQSFSGGDLHHTRGTKLA
jgi:hypothetical protein